MKKLALFLALILALTCTAFAEASAESVTSGDFQYTVLDDGTAMITGYNGSAYRLDIPSVLDEYKVTCIWLRAFFNCKNLTSISIPDSVISIGEEAFASCRQLTAIYVSPDHPVYAVIDNVLFDKTTKTLLCYPAGLSETEYSIPDGIISIGAGAFAYCRNLTSVNLPDSVTSMGEGAFLFCESLTSINIPDFVTSIGEDIFYNCDNLTLTVGRDSYAYQYAKDNDIPYTYADANDWLNS